MRGERRAHRSDAPCAQAELRDHIGLGLVAVSAEIGGRPSFSAARATFK